MSSRRPVVITLLVLGAIVLAVVLVKVLDTVGDPEPNAGSIPLSAVISRQTPAVAPFEGLGELKIAVGYDRCLRVAVADSLDERAAGLRDRTDLGPYDGMLFVFDGPTDVGFTMSGVTDPLQIAFYASDGSRTSGQLMEPCPEKVETECPVYRADGPYQYAIETRKGQLPGGPVNACSPT
jgi:uncharacterized membrane protein (UPF0127 family)